MYTLRSYVVLDQLKLVKNFITVAILLCMIMNFPVALIFHVLSIVAVLVHTDNQCTITPSCNCHLNNVEILDQLIDIKIRAALTNVPGI